MIRGYLLCEFDLGHGDVEVLDLGKDGGWRDARGLLVTWGDCADMVGAVFVEKWCGLRVD